MAGPPRPPDRADMNTRAQVGAASQRASGYDTLNRVFNMLLPFLGRHTQMPMMTFGQTPGLGSWSVRDKSVFGAQVLHDLLYGRGHERQVALDVLTHELAHTQQRMVGPQGSSAPRWVTEGGASAFSNGVRDLVARGLHIPTDVIPPDRRGLYGGWEAHMLSEMPHSYIFGGQFRNHRQPRRLDPPNPFGNA